MITIDVEKRREFEEHYTFHQTPSVIEEEEESFGIIVDEHGEPTGFYSTKPSEVPVGDWRTLILDQMEVDQPVIVATRDPQGAEQIFRFDPAETGLNRTVSQVGIAARTAHKASMVFITVDALPTS